VCLAHRYQREGIVAFPWKCFKYLYCAQTRLVCTAAAQVKHIIGFVWEQRLAEQQYQEHIVAGDVILSETVRL
jgi:hypothetical protein